MRYRLARASDGAELSRIYGAHVHNSPASFELVPPDASSMADRVINLLPQYPFVVACDNDSLAGYAYASPHRPRPAYGWTAEVSVYVDASQQRRGVARSLYRSLFALLRAQGYRQLLAGITLPNPASIGLHESFGFTRSGLYRAVGYKLGAWHDVSWWQLGLDDSVTAPTEVMDIDQLGASMVAAALGE